MSYDKSLLLKKDKFFLIGSKDAWPSFTGEKHYLSNTRWQTSVPLNPVTDTLVPKAVGSTNIFERDSPKEKLPMPLPIRSADTEDGHGQWSSKYTILKFSLNFM